MIRRQTDQNVEVTEDEWVSFPGGELEAPRPKVLCPTCRERLRAEARAGGSGRAPDSRPLCFECYRVDLARARAMRKARDLNTATEARFQTTLPFEPVNRPRLERLRAERKAARAALEVGPGRFADRRRRAQIAARHALQRIAASLQSSSVPQPVRHGAMADAIHAAELQLPDAWLPFVVSR
jgi:hypothetical protein